MTIEHAFLLPPSLFASAAPAPLGGRLLHEDGAFFLLESGLGYLSLE